MPRFFQIAVTLSASLLFSLPAHAKLFKWVDNQGITHYGETVPPEYADKDKQTLKKSGMIEKKPEAPDQKSLDAKKAAEQKRLQEQEAEMVIKRRNSMLLNTYSNENEIDQARDRSLVLINARIESNKMLLKSTQSTLDDLQKESDARSKAGKKIPQSLINDITQTEARVTKYNSEITRNEAEMNETRERFEKEKELYRQLKGTNKK